MGATDRCGRVDTSNRRIGEEALRWYERFFRRELTEKQLDAELRFHLEHMIADLVAAGMAPEEAQRRARLEFGGLEQVKEECREVGGLHIIETFIQDLRYGLRQLRRNPGFTAVVVLTLALGIGVNTAIFSLVDQILLWSIPAREPSQLVKIDGFYSGSYPFFCAYRDLNRIFSGVLASSDNIAASLRPQGAPGVEVGHVEYVSGGYFHILGIGSAAGRVINPSDDVAPGSSPVAVLSYDYWEQRFDGNLRVIGQKLAVNGYPVEIVGVAEKGFGGLFNGKEPDAFIPLAMYPLITPSAARVWSTTHMTWLSVVARLKPGISIQQAQAGMQVLWPEAAAAVNGAAPKAASKARRRPEDEARLVPASRAPSFILNRGFLDPLEVLAIATALVLLIACANVGNLLLVRASQRWKETAVRLSLGATRARLTRQFLTESLLLAAGGGIIGFTFAYFGVRALARAAILTPDLRFHLSLFVLVSCVGITLLTILLFGLVPALRVTRMVPAESMKENGPATQTVSRSRISKSLVTLQVALSLMLLVVASLFIRTLWNLQNVNLGFQRKNIAIFDTNPTNLGYRGQRLGAFYDQLLERARRVHGVRSAALSGMVPLGNYFSGSQVSASGSQAKFLVFLNPVSSGYFTTLGVPLLFGRDFRPEDGPAVTPGESVLGQLGRTPGGGKFVDASRVCIIDESLAQHLYGTANVVGRYLCYPDSKCSPGHVPQIIGVVRGIHYGGIKAPDSEGSVYEPSWSNGPAARYLEVRFAGSVAPVIAGIRRALQRQDPNVPLLRVRTMQEYIDSHLARERLTAYLSTFFGILALALAAVGLYGVLAYAVTQRRREIGIRIALGAQRGDVVGLILRESILPVLAGVVIGLLGAFVSSFLIGSLLYGVSSWNLESTLFAIITMLVVALVACYIPARRAAKVDPMVALRYE